MFYERPVDWKLAIKRQREPLLVIVTGLYAMIGLAEGGMVEWLKRPLYRKVLRTLRPAEAAVRRLIIAMALGLGVKPQAASAASSERSTSGKSKGQDKGEGKNKSKSQGQKRSLFRLFDPPRRISPLIGRRRRKRPLVEPRIRVLDFDYDPSNPLFLRLIVPPVPPPPVRDDGVNAKSLCRRLAAIMHALKDLPRQAERYARWRDTPLQERRPKRDDALRTGPPPYLRRKSKHEVHEILRECHSLAHYALKLDTS